MSAAQELGLRVPQDVSMVGYDNTSLAQMRHLWLTSVDNANTEVGPAGRPCVGPADGRARRCRPRNS